MHVRIAILGQRPPAAREAWVEAVRHGPDGVDVELTLDDGTPAHTGLTAFDAAWLEVEAGQVVWVDVCTAPPCAAVSGGVLVGVSA